MSVPSCVMCVCVLAGMQEAVRAHRGALEVFYHAAVIVARLQVVTLHRFPSREEYSAYAGPVHMDADIFFTFI